MLYILATLGVTAILLIVAFADLSSTGSAGDSTPQNKSDLSAFRFLCKSCCQITRFLASFLRFKPVHIIESLDGLPLHNPPAFTSPVDEVLRGVRTRGLRVGVVGGPHPLFCEVLKESQIDFLTGDRIRVGFDD